MQFRRTGAALGAILGVALATQSCAVSTGLLELSGVHWSESSYTERVPREIDDWPVTMVELDLEPLRMVCLRTTPADVSTTAQRYGTISKIIMGMFVLFDGAVATAIFTADERDVGATSVGVFFAADAAVTLGLIALVPERLDVTRAPPPQYTTVRRCPGDSGIVAGGVLFPVDGGGSLAGDASALRAALDAGGEIFLRVDGRDVHLALEPGERAGDDSVLVVLEQPAFVLRQPVIPPTPPPAPGAVP